MGTLNELIKLKNKQARELEEARLTDETKSLITMTLQARLNRTRTLIFDTETDKKRVLRKEAYLEELRLTAHQLEKALAELKEL